MGTVELQGSVASRHAAMKFIVCLGLVSLFADATYEGARSIVGPYLKDLGANTFQVGIIIGFGEMCAASLRYFSGKLADRTRAYWPLAISGYLLNIVVVPGLAFAGNWKLAALLVIAERTGKALRGPSRDVLLSEATSEVGHGWGFGIHGAMDQTGAVLGPLWVAWAVLRAHNHFQPAFLPLIIPATAAVIALLVAKSVHPGKGKPPKTAADQVLPKVFRVYVVAAGLLALGYIDFPFFAIHWVSHSLTTNSLIPVLYAAAMGGEGLAGLVIGRLYDRYGIAILSWCTLISLFSLPLGFLGGLRAALVAVACWAVGKGAQDACLRSGIASAVSMNKRGNAFGVFNAVWGVLWFAGSAAVGFLYLHSILAVVVFGMVTQLCGAVLFFILRKSLAAAS